MTLLRFLSIKYTIATFQGLRLPGERKEKVKEALQISNRSRKSLYKNVACREATPKTTNQKPTPTTLRMLSYLPNTGHNHGTQ